MTTSRYKGKIDSDVPFVPSKLFDHKWYELARYNNWFEPSVCYNTTAEYIPLEDETFLVHNKTQANGTAVEVFGIGRHLEKNEFRVDFPLTEIVSLPEKYKATLGSEIKPQIPSSGPPNQDKVGGPPQINLSEPNYIVLKTWECHVKGIKYFVVTDPKRETMFLFSQWTDPSESDYAMLMKYIAEEFDITRVIQVAHYNNEFYRKGKELRPYHKE